MVQSMIMKVLLNSILLSLFLSSICCSTLEAATPSKGLGVAVEPMNISVQRNKVAYFNIYNDTDFDYIITTKVVLSDHSNINVNGKTPFTVTSPIGYIKERSHIQMGLVYLPDKELDENKYFLSVSFIPKRKNTENSITAPIILEHQIPISVVKKT